MVTTATNRLRIACASTTQDTGDRRTLGAHKAVNGNGDTEEPQQGLDGIVTGLVDI